MTRQFHGTRSAAQLVRIALLALAVVSVCGCGKRAPGGGSRVWILRDGSSDPMRGYQVSLLQKLVRASEGTDASTVPSKGAVEAQIGQVRAAMTAHASVIMIFPEDAAKLAPVLREAMSAGVRVIAFASDMPEDACTCAVYCDDRRIGEIAGEHVVPLLKKKAEARGMPATAGRVVMLRGDEESASCARETEGFLRATAQFPGVVLVHDAPCGWSGAAAGDRTREALRIQKPFDVIYAQSDAIGAGAAEAVREGGGGGGQAVMIVGTGGAPGKEGGAAMVLRGELQATVYVPPLVDAAWEVAERLLEGGPDTEVRKRMEVKPFLITQENAGRIRDGALPKPETE